MTHVTEGALIGKLSVAEVTIIDDDEIGELVLEKEELVVEGDVSPSPWPLVDSSEARLWQEAQVTVLRTKGCSGEVRVLYRTEFGNAVAPNDYIHTEGELIMDHNQAAGVIKIPLRST